MKKVILIVSEQFQPDACGFVSEFEKLGGKLDGVVCLMPQNSVKVQVKKNLRFLKKLSPSSLKRGAIAWLAAIFNMRTLALARAGLASIMPSAGELIAHKFDLFRYAQEKKMPLHFSPGLTPALVKQLTAGGPAIFPTYAGGIWSRELLETPGAEFINAHMGEMPHYRGMNVIEWAVLEGKQPRVAVMVMNDKIDGGDVIFHKDIAVQNVKSVFDLRRLGFTSCYTAMAEGIHKYQKGEEDRKQQPKGARYYYRMHAGVKQLIEAKLAESK
jgi:hypothetical protein